MNWLLKAGRVALALFRLYMAAIVVAGVLWGLLTVFQDLTYPNRAPDSRPEAPLGEEATGQGH